MEYRKPHQIINGLLEARYELHSDLSIQTALIERIQMLPDDDHCRSGRESLQLGAGLGYLESLDKQSRSDAPARTKEQALEIFFATQPFNRYMDADLAAIERQSVTRAALYFHETGSVPDLEAHIDPYQVEAACMFIEGYELVLALAPSQPATADVLAS